MSSLSRLTLQGFKSIRELDLTLGPLNVLIGANGAGKSNLLSFFRMLGAIADGKLQLFVGKQGGANALLHYGRKRTQELGAKVHFDVTGGENTYAMTLVTVAPDDLMFSDEEVTHQRTVRSQAERYPLLEGGHRESRLDRAIADGNKTAETVKYNLDRWRFFHFHDTSTDAQVKLKGPIGDNRFLRANGENLAAFLYMLQQAHPAHYERIRETVRMAAPFLDDLVLFPDALNPSYIQLQWRERGSDVPFFAYQLSDGTLRFIALTTMLLQPELPTSPHTILIDEPELGLHPYAITLLASMMRSASKGVQLVVSTQSVTLIDALAEPDEVIVVERKDQQSTFRRCDPKELEVWLEDYSLGELWEKNVLGGRP
jgi:predicted ATPase